METAVVFKVMGVKLRAVFPSQTVTAENAREMVLSEMAKSFDVESVEQVKPPKKMTTVWATYADGFKSFFNNEK